MKKIGIAILISAFALSANAAGTNITWTKASDIANFSAAVSNLAKTGSTNLSINMPVYFPKAIPVASTGTTYYANSDVSPKTYNLYIDNNATCKGTKVCNLMTMTIMPSTEKQKLASYKDMQNHNLTHRYYLGHGKFGNYTPGFALGDYWNPQLSWITEQKLNDTKMYYVYTLSWVGTKSVGQTRDIMLDMARKLENFAPSLSAVASAS